MSLRCMVSETIGTADYEVDVMSMRRASAPVDVIAAAECNSRQSQAMPEFCAQLSAI